MVGPARQCQQLQGLLAPAGSANERQDLVQHQARALRTRGGEGPGQGQGARGRTRGHGHVRDARTEHHRSGENHQ